MKRTNEVKRLIKEIEELSPMSVEAQVKRRYLIRLLLEILKELIKELEDDLVYYISTLKEVKKYTNESDVQDFIDQIVDMVITCNKFKLIEKFVKDNKKTLSNRRELLKLRGTTQVTFVTTLLSELEIGEEVLNINSGLDSLVIECITVLNTLISEE